MKAFITGATGFVGRNLLQWLYENRRDWQVTCLVRDEARARGQWPSDIADWVRWLPGDLTDPYTYSEAILDAEYIYHAAALVSLRDGPEFHAANVDTTRIMLETADLSTELRRLVFLSSISAIDRPADVISEGPLTEEDPPNPSTDYGKSKLMAEKLVMTAGLPYAILRPAYIFGPYPRLNGSMDRLVYDVAQGKPYTRYPFPGRASSIFAPDLAEIIETAGHHPGADNDIFFVGDREPVVIHEAYALIAKELGIDYRPIEATAEDMERTRNQLYLRYPWNPLVKIMFEDTFYCSTDKWYHATARPPAIGFEEGVARTVRWYKDQGLV